MNRSGSFELVNGRDSIGLSLGDIKVQAKAKLSAEGRSQADKQLGGDSSQAGSSASLAYDITQARPIEERYSGSFWSFAPGDATFDALRTALDGAAAASEQTRSQREVQFQSMVDKAAIAMGPYGVVLIAAVEAFKWVVSKFGGESGDSEADRARAIAAAKTLWDKWRIKPTAFLGDIVTARSYADHLETFIRALDSTEGVGEVPSWRESWVATVDRALQSKSDAILDVQVLQWFPFSMDEWSHLAWARPAEGTKWGSWNTHWDLGNLVFGQSRWVTKKPGFLSAKKAVTTTWKAATFEDMERSTARFAAGLGVMVAVAKGKLVEPVVEAAVVANRKYLQEIGPSPHLQNWRLKAVFLATMAAADKAPKMPEKIMKRDAVSAAMAKIADMEIRKKTVLTFKPGALSMLIAQAQRDLLSQHKLPLLEQRGAVELERFHKLAGFLSISKKLKI